MATHDLNERVEFEWDNRGLEETELTSGDNTYRVGLPFTVSLIENAFENAGYPPDDYMVHLDAIRKLLKGEGREWEAL